jgi:hypothetical protein
MRRPLYRSRLISASMNFFIVRRISSYSWLNFIGVRLSSALIGR